MELLAVTTTSRLTADWFLRRAATESTKHIIGWLSVQAREIRDGYLMKRSDFNTSLQHVWEDETDGEGMMGKKMHLLYLVISLKLDHQGFNVTSYRGILC